MCAYIGTANDSTGAQPRDTWQLGYREQEKDADQGDDNQLLDQRVGKRSDRAFNQATTVVGDLDLDIVRQSSFEFRQFVLDPLDSGSRIGAGTHDDGRQRH